MKIKFQKHHRLYMVRRILAEEGISYTLRSKIIPYILRPIDRLIKRKRFLLEVFLGVIPRLYQSLPFVGPSAGFIKIPRSELMERMRRFWYANTPGDFELGGERVSRQDMFRYGGPSAEFNCAVCQKSEWLSRVKQKNLFEEHGACPGANRCQILCGRQGDELWTHFHQNFDFSLGVDESLPAPKGLYILYGPKQIFFASRMEPMERILRRQFAYCCQMDVVERPGKIDWSRYDFLFMYHTGSNWRFSRPKNVSVILFGHDFWPEHQGYQWVIDWLKPDVLLSSFPGLWKKYFRFSSHTRVAFHPMFPSLFFTRSNLGLKQIDALVIGNTRGPLYEQRRLLDKQLSELTERYRVEFSHVLGTFPPNRELGVEQEDPSSGTKLRYLNKWSEYLGSAKYVVFGRVMKYPVLVGKYYEALGSGAIPIFPEVPDLKLLGIKPFEHYIPLSEVEGDNEKLAFYLDHYQEYKHIAESAVNWYRQNSDKMLFEGFEEVVRSITKYEYPKRLV